MPLDPLATYAFGAHDWPPPNNLTLLWHCLYNIVPVVVVVSSRLQLTFLKTSFKASLFNKSIE